MCQITYPPELLPAPDEGQGAEVWVDGVLIHSTKGGEDEMVDENKATVGQMVNYVDTEGQRRMALVTAVHPGMSGQADGINCVGVNKDENQTDSYGRKLERWTSVPHKTGQPAQGNYWFA